MRCLPVSILNLAASGTRRAINHQVAYSVVCMLLLQVSSLVSSYCALFCLDAGSVDESRLDHAQVTSSGHVTLPINLKVSSPLRCTS
jgi:hypothetical protein